MISPEKQSLLDQATPRPWRIEEDGNEGWPWIYPNGAYSTQPGDNQLIVAAVNDYEQLLRDRAERDTLKEALRKIERRLSVLAPKSNALKIARAALSSPTTEEGT